FAAYWWQWPAVGEPQARALALVVLMAGYQTLVFAERVALPASGMQRIPRTVVFWGVWLAAVLSLVVILYVPSVAQLFRVSPPGGPRMLAAVALGVAAVAWRLVARGGIADDAH
ncbi:MAG: cation transporting ATPase C-terminal domain-containing protein, partial [Betaproteobacteria bacterium]